MTFIIKHMCTQDLTSVGLTTGTCWPQSRHVQPAALTAQPPGCGAVRQHQGSPLKVRLGQKEISSLSKQWQVEGGC